MRNPESETLFDVYIAVDWSAKNSPSPAKPSKDAIWIGERDNINKIQKETYWRSRSDCVNYLYNLLKENVSKNKRTIIGYDFDFGFPAGFINSLKFTGNEAPWLKMWKKLNELIIDNELNQNNRFKVASYLNSLCKDPNNTQIGPLWGHPVKQKYDDLFYKSPSYPFRISNNVLLKKFRWTEQRESKAQPVWKLIGSASVGGQSLVGIPAVYKLRFDKVLQTYSKVWPFETGFNAIESEQDKPQILHVEIWPGILSSTLDKSLEIRDQAQVRATVNWLEQNDQLNTLRQLLETPDDLSKQAKKECVEEEGWVIGSGTRPQGLL